MFLEKKKNEHCHTKLTLPEVLRINVIRNF
jgi:hypothetical protein